MATSIDPTTSLGDLVTRHPSLARALEQRGLDYCCGGDRSLAGACRDAGLDVDAVVADLATEAADEPPPDWASMSAPDLVDHLLGTHHRYLWSELPRLSALSEKVLAVHGDRHPELRQVHALYEEIRADLEPHLLKEERILFPMIRDLASATEARTYHCGSVRNPISVMLREHDTVGDLLARLRSATGGYVPPADGCGSYVALYEGLAQLEADTHQHVHKENNLLFPTVVALEDRLLATRA